MAGKATIIIQGTAWGVRETQNGKRYLSVSVSPGYRDRNGNWVSQPEQYYSVWPAGYANLNPVFDQFMGDHISCSSEFSIAETMDTLKSMFPTEQPNFETIAIEAAHEDGEQNG